MIPKNELELIILFSSQCSKYDFEIISAQSNLFPDAIIRKNEIEYRVEFEYKSSNFWLHSHNPADCDLIICWVNDDDCPVLPIIELSKSEWWKTDLFTPDEMKMVRYWKKRALLAESKLEYQPIIIYKSKPEKDISNIKSRIAEMLSMGKSRSFIAIELFGSAGGNQLAQIDKIISEL